MKAIELKGSPFDGETLGFSGPEAAAYFIVAAGHPERPVYRCSCCSCCAADMEVVDYHFVGYEYMFKKGELVHEPPKHRHDRAEV
jgi:hypothetical protein